MRICAIALGWLLMFGWTATWAAATALQPLIDATLAGGTLRLAPGVYQGPATISRPLRIEGGGKALIQGDSHSTVLTVIANGNFQL